MNRTLSIPFTEAAACPVYKSGPALYVYAMLHALCAKTELSSQISVRMKRFNSGLRNCRLKIWPYRNDSIQAHHSNPIQRLFNNNLSFPAKAGNPVRRGLSFLPRLLWNTGSPAPVRNCAQGG